MSIAVANAARLLLVSRETADAGTQVVALAAKIWEAGE